MGNFNRGGRRSFGGGGGGFGGRRGGDRGGRPTMHQATCAECGNECEIPFRPTGDRPVYCSDCFRNQGSDNNRGGGRFEERRGGGRFEGRNSGRSNFFEDKQMTEAVCDKCGKECEVPFRPTKGKPIYCSDCFGKGGNDSGGNKNSDQYKEQFANLNAKLDKILKILNPIALSNEIKPETVKNIENVENVGKDKKDKKAKKEKIVETQFIASVDKKDKKDKKGKKEKKKK